MTFPFLDNPSIPEPVTDDHAATKGYVDDRMAVVANQGRIGDVSWWTLPTLPDDAVACEGQQITAAAWPELHALLTVAGNPFGTAGGNPLVLNMKGLMPVGQDTAQIEFDTLLETGGAKAVTLTVPQLPYHSAYLAGATTGWSYVASAGPVGAPIGNNEPHQNLPPYRVGRFIMRARSTFAGLDTFDLASESYVSSQVAAAIATAVAQALADQDALNIGKVYDWAGPVSTIPAKHVAAFGQALNRTTYAALFAKLCPQISVGDEISIDATADTVQFVGPHDLAIGDAVFFESTGSGISANTQYYVRTVPTSSQITLTTSRTVSAITGAVAMGAALDITATGVVPNKGYRCPHGITSSTLFNAPDYRGRTSIGLDNMGGTDAARIGWANVVGMSAGEATHLSTSAESGLRDHIHYEFPVNYTAVPQSGGTTVGGTALGSAKDSGTTGVAGGPLDASQGHNNIQPSILVNKIIYTG